MMTKLTIRQVMISLLSVSSPPSYSHFSGGVQCDLSVGEYLDPRIADLSHQDLLLILELCKGQLRL